MTTPTPSDDQPTLFSTSEAVEHEPILGVGIGPERYGHGVVYPTVPECSACRDLRRRVDVLELALSELGKRFGKNPDGSPVELI